MAGADVRVVGLTELRRELARLGRRGGVELRRANEDVGKLVSDATASRMSGAGGLAARVAPTMEVARSAGVTVVQAGGPNAPFSHGVEYGATQWNQFAPWRGNGSDAGYHLWPTIRESGREIRETYWQAVLREAKRAFPE